MNTKLLLIIAFSYFYGFFEIAMSLRQRLRRKKEILLSGDRGSLWVLISLTAVGYVLAFNFAARLPGRIYHWNLFFAMGSVMVILGLVLRIAAIQTLRQHFTYTVTQVEQHELIRTGLYSRIRHPGYLGQILVFTGTALALSNYLSLLGMVIPVMIGYLNRIGVEEKFMERSLGEKYLDYQKKTKKLLPGIF